MNYASFTRLAFWQVGPRLPAIVCSSRRRRDYALPPAVRDLRRIDHAPRRTSRFQNTQGWRCLLTLTCFEPARRRQESRRSPAKSRDGGERHRPRGRSFTLSPLSYLLTPRIDFYYPSRLTILPAFFRFVSTWYPAVLIRGLLSAGNTSE